MKSIILLLFILLFLTPLPAQEPDISKKIFELEKKIAPAQGKEKVDIMNDFVIALNDRVLITTNEFDLDKSVEFGKKSLTLARLLKYRKGEAQALAGLAKSYNFLGDYEKAVKEGEDALNIFTELNDKTGIALCLHCMGFSFNKLNKIDKSLELNYIALKIAEQINDKNRIAKCLFNIGHNFNSLNNYNKALESYLNALKFAEEINDKEHITICLINIGATYYNQNQYDKAIEFYFKAIKFAEQINDKNRIAKCLDNIGSTYNSLGSYDKALEFDFRALKIAEEINDKQQIAISLSTIAGVYGSTNDFKNALNYGLKSLKIWQMLGDYVQVAYLHHQLGEIYFAQKNYPQALILYEKSLKFAKDIKDEFLLSNIYLNLATIYAQMAEYKKAYEYHKLFYEYDRKVFSANSQKQINQLQEKFYADNREKQIAGLNKEKLLIENKRKLIENEKNLIAKDRKNKILLFISIISIMILVLALVGRKLRKFFMFWKKSSYIGDYLLLNRISVGGMGSIYKGQHRTTRAIAAVKIMRDEFYQDMELRKRFNNEASIIKGLEHPNIVRFIDRGEWESKLFIIMEYLDGITLTALLSQNKLKKLREQLPIMMQTTAAINYLHGRQIMHRDLKPDNIMLISKDDDRLTVKLLDFGIAKGDCQTRLTHTGDILGSTNYISPEAIMGEKPTLASDIFALGIIFYEILTNRRLFEADSATLILDKICNEIPAEPVEIIPAIPAGLSSLVMGMIQKDPVCRPTAGQIAHALKIIFFDMAATIPQKG